MQKSMVRVLALAAAACFSFQASALTLNGVNYKRVNGMYGICPDGNAKLIYKGAAYCRYYSADLGWNIPSTRVDGSPLPLSELSGYEVYWTRDSDKYSGVIKVSGGTSQKAVLQVFTPDTYHFAISAIDNKGLKSPLSSIVDSTLAR